MRRSATAHEQDREALLGAAVRAGKFSRERQEHYRALFDADPKGTRELLAAMAPVLAGEPPKAPKPRKPNVIEPYQDDSYPADWLGRADEPHGPEGVVIVEED